MKRIISALVVWLLLASWAASQTLQFEIQGGPQLTIRAKAEQQQWLMLGGKILVAAVADGKLVVQEFAWPPGPQPGPDPGPGPSPKPDPEPEPKPDPKPAKWQVAFFVESDGLDNLAAVQQAMLASLLVRRDLEAKGHRLVGVLDPDASDTATDPALQAWFQAAKGKAPCVAIAPMEGGAIRVYPLPSDREALWKLLENPPAEPPPPPKQPACSGGRCFR